jgi:hypothetical protein
MHLEIVGCLLLHHRDLNDRFLAVSLILISIKHRKIWSILSINLFQIDPLLQVIMPFIFYMTVVL